MKKLTDINLNTAEYFNKIWDIEMAEAELQKFDTVRMQAIVKYIKPGDKVCDMGAGIFGFGQFYLEDGGNAEVTALDFSAYARDFVKKRCPKIDYVIGDVLHTVFRDKYFDMVGASEVIEHMEKPEELVKEMARITKSGGVMVIGTVDPDCEDAKLANRKYPEHLWQFTKEDLIALLEPYGEVIYERIGDYDHVICRCR